MKRLQTSRGWSAFGGLVAGVLMGAALGAICLRRREDETIGFDPTPSGVPPGADVPVAPSRVPTSQRRKTRVVVLAIGLIALSSAATVAGMVGSSRMAARENRESAIAMTGGDPDRGRAAVDSYGCSSCHTIPGVRGANALVGPSLAQMGGRSYVAGVLPNTPRNLIRWIENPPAIDDKTAMPNVGVTGPDARDIAAYLYTLRE